MSEINRPYSAYLMDALTYSRNLRRARQFSQSLLEIYELIPDLEPDIQERLEPLEKKIESLYVNIKNSIDEGSEYAVSVELNEKTQAESAKLLREARRLLMSELVEAGYFEFEKGSSGFYNPSEGRKSGEKSAGFGATVRRQT